MKLSKNLVVLIQLNNAVIQIISPIVDFSVSSWRKLFDIHMTDTLLVTQASYETYD